LTTTLPPADPGRRVLRPWKTTPAPNREFGRRTRRRRHLPQRRCAHRLADMLLIEQNDEWLVARRYLSEHSLHQILVCAGTERDISPSSITEEVIDLDAA
jgi:hypothetical protein